MSGERSGDGLHSPGSVSARGAKYEQDAARLFRRGKAPPHEIRILALDLGTKTGWAAATPGIGVESGVQVFDLRRGESPGMRFLRFRRWLGQMLEDLSPELVVYELAHHRGGPATELAVGFQTRVQELAAARGVEYTSVHTATLKKHATGSGRAGKPAMIAAAAARWPDQVLEDDNQADALCLLAWGLADVGEG